MASTQHPRCHPPLHGRRQLQQAERVGDLRPGTPDPAGQLLLGAAEVLQQLVVRRSLFQGVQLAAVEVLEQRVAQQVVVGCLTDDGRDRRQPRDLGRAPAPLTHDQLVATRTGRADHHGLEQPDLLDGVDQLGQRLLVEHGPGLARVGTDAGDVEIGEVGKRSVAGRHPGALSCVFCWALSRAGGGADGRAGGRLRRPGRPGRCRGIVPCTFAVPRTLVRGRRDQRAQATSQATTSNIHGCSLLVTPCRASSRAASR